VLVCLLGGLIGIICSPWGAGRMFSLFVTSHHHAVFPACRLSVAFLCSTMIGVIFGFLPARNAARLDPIEALARE
jgi:macrolide transport system ATP-binding/permease protein